MAMVREVAVVLLLRSATAVGASSLHQWPLWRLGVLIVLCESARYLLGFEWMLYLECVWLAVLMGTSQSTPSLKWPSCGGSLSRYVWQRCRAE